MTKVNLNGEEVSVEMPEVEFEKVKELLNREPSITELGGFDVMWSEHCSYKNSILELNFPPKKEKPVVKEVPVEKKVEADLVEKKADTATQEKNIDSNKETSDNN